MAVKVAILGGGMGSLAAAWKLAQAGGYDITVYQRDWLLGGKGASGRNSTDPGPVPAPAGRIEEHGIHLLMGFYNNALGLLQECYGKLDPVADGVLPWDSALTAWDEMTMADPKSGGWGFWKIPFPQNAEPIGSSGSPTILMMVSNAFGWLVTFLGKAQAAGPPLPFIVAFKKAVAFLFTVAQQLVGWGLPVGWIFSVIKWWLDHMLQGTWMVLGPLVATNTELRRLWISIWFVGTNLRGMIHDGILYPPHDFSVIDHLDYREWLRTRSPVAVPPEVSWNSPPVTGLYDLAFSNNHQLSAGTVTYNALHIALAYKGHVAYKMNAGMGEVVFSPLYLALKAGGVKFKFYHEVTTLRVKKDQITGENVISSVEFATRQPSSGTYDPLITTAVKVPNGQQFSIHAWPSTPNDTFGLPQPQSIDQGGNFDIVVLGISVGALAPICAELGQAHAPFQQMMDGLKTLQTQSIQLWLDRPLDQMGWPHGSAAVISHARPFNSWVDMTHLVPSEQWPAGGPQCVAYFCDELPDTGATTKPPEQVVRENAENFIKNDLPSMWSTFTPDDLHDPSGQVGMARLDAQHLRANVYPSDRYVICAPGTNPSRLAAGESGFRNLALAGDWVKTALNTGCLEAATLGGFNAAAAIVSGKVQP